MSNPSHLNGVSKIYFGGSLKKCQGCGFQLKVKAQHHHLTNIFIYCKKCKKKKKEAESNDKETNTRIR